jgi:hypothetical protein
VGHLLFQQLYFLLVLCNLFFHALDIEFFILVKRNPYRSYDNKSNFFFHALDIEFFILVKGNSYRSYDNKSNLFFLALDIDFFFLVKGNPYRSYDNKSYDNKIGSCSFHQIKYVKQTTRSVITPRNPLWLQTKGAW